MDFTSAFLNGNLKEEVYTKQPEGFVEKQKEHLVCKLKHSLYGLKQSPRCWNTVLDVQLKRMGFEQSSSDPCIYTLSGGATFIIGVYVDDIILAGKDHKQMEDNQAAIMMAKNPQYHGRSKHISIKYHFIQEQVISNLIELRYCRTDDMIADIFTKGLSTTKFIKLRDMAGIKDLSVCE